MEYIDNFIKYLKVIKKYSNYTIINYKQDISELESFLKNKKINLISINYDYVKDYLTYLYDRKISRVTISRKLSSLRSFYNYLVNNEIVKVNYFKEVNNPKKEKKLPIFLTDEELEKVCLIPDKKTSLGQRNLLIIEMLYATGVRVGELVNIKLRDIDFTNRLIKILGKGSKERIVVYNHHTENILDLYLNDGRRKLIKDDNNYLFLNKNGSKLSERMIRNIINDLISKTDIKIHISPHNFRHSFATEMLNNGADLVSVKELLGHESLNTTSIYTNITDEQVRKVYNNAHPRARR